MAQYTGMVRAQYPTPDQRQTNNLFGDLLAKLDNLPSPQTTRR